jgi:hypothetical protein
MGHSFGTPFRRSNGISNLELGTRSIAGIGPFFGLIGGLGTHLSEPVTPSCSAAVPTPSFRFKGRALRGVRQGNGGSFSVASLGSMNL